MTGDGKRETRNVNGEAAEPLFTYVAAGGVGVSGLQSGEAHQSR